MAIAITKSLKNIEHYNDWNLLNLTQIKGVGEIKAITLLAAIELGRRSLIAKQENKISVSNAQTIYELFKYDLLNLKQENLIAIFLDTKKILEYVSWIIFLKNTHIIWLIAKA